MRRHVLPVVRLLGDLEGAATRTIAHRLITEHGVASIPVSAFLYKDTGGPVLRFCFAKKDETLHAAAERLASV